MMIRARARMRRLSQMQQAAVARVIQIRPAGELYAEIEEFRRNEPDIPSRPQAVCRLVRRGLGMPKNHAHAEAGQRRTAGTEK
jgi:hypothetical protein